MIWWTGDGIHVMSVDRPPAEVDTSARLVRRLLTAQFPQWAELPLASAGPAGWMHGDLHPANLLVDRGRLSGVLDFGLVAVGDPACDLMVAWTFLSAPARERFRAALPADGAVWARARGWALDLGLMCAARAPGDPVLADIGRRTVREVVADQPIC